MSMSHFAVQKDSHLVWLCERSRTEVRIQTISDNQKVDRISPLNWVLPQQLTQGQTSIPHDSRANRFCLLFRDGRSIDAQVVFEEQEVTLVDPVDLSRSVEAVEQPKGFSVSFSRRTRPGSIRPSHIAMGHILG